jgi:predicted CXXCH cytochrome family protein
MMKKLDVLLLGLGMMVALAAPASDPPHWAGAPTNPNNTDCTNKCHQSHSGAGGGLTQSASNVNLCQTCHNSAAVNLAENLPVENQDKAIPGVGGIHHGFDAAAVSATAGAALPANSDMYRLSHGFGDKVVCSTCHDQHAATSANGGTSRTSAAKKITALGSTGTLASGGSYTGASGVWYLVEIQSPGGTGVATFRWSKDSGTTWMASGVLTGGGVVLNNGVTVTFANGTGPTQFAAGERWEFYAAWPFLRVKVDQGDNASSDKFCRDCHSSWVMDHSGVNVYTGAAKSHPVGIALNANAAGYDRAVPLDGNGAQQGAGGDTNASNNLKLDASGRIQCLTCHGVHYTDSNTLSEDGP